MKECHVAWVLCFDFTQLCLCAFRLILLAGRSGARSYRCLSRVLVRFSLICSCLPERHGTLQSASLFISPQPQEEAEGQEEMTGPPTLPCRRRCGVYPLTDLSTHCLPPLLPSSAPARATLFIISKRFLGLTVLRGLCLPPWRSWQSLSS